MTAQDDTEALRDARALAMQTLWVLSHVERGRAPIRRLRQHADPDIVEAIREATGEREPGPVAPALVKVPGARITSDGLTAHLTGLARRPDGSTSAYVVELGRASVLRDWMVSELTTVEEHRLLGERPREYDRNLPDELADLITAATQQRDRTAEQLRAAHQRWQDADRELRRRHRAEVERRQAAAQRAEEELAAYTQTEQFRQARDRLLEDARQQREAEWETDWDIGR